jgi:hypothetical protein
MPRPILCLTLFTLAMGAAACTDDATTSLAAPDDALLAVSSSAGLCTYDGSADYLIQLRIRDYCPSSVLARWEDEEGVTVQEDVFWLAGREDGGDDGDNFETAETVVSEQDGEWNTCLILARAESGRKPLRIEFTVPSHVDCPNRFRRIPDDKTLP